MLGLESAEVAKVLAYACRELVPKLEQAGDEIEHLLDALEGKYVPAGPAGAPTRGMAHILPPAEISTPSIRERFPRRRPGMWGSNWRARPSSAFAKKKAYYPEMMGLSVWGTSPDAHPWRRRCRGLRAAAALSRSGMRNRGGWRASRSFLCRKLGRPRIDVTLRISGFFRDAFPHLIDLFDQAVHWSSKQTSRWSRIFPANITSRTWRSIRTFRQKRRRRRHVTACSARSLGHTVQESCP